MPQTYWLLDWLDAEGLATADAALSALNGDATTRSNFVEAADVAMKSPSDLESFRGEALLAGAGLDLSGSFACAAVKCMKQRMDELVSKCWYYFDTVFVHGLDPYEGARLVSRQSDRRDSRLIRTHLELAFHARAMGVENYLCFVRRPYYYTEHLEAHAHEAGLPKLSETLANLTNYLNSGYKFLKLEKNDLRWQYALQHPGSTYIATGTISALRGDNEARLKKRISKSQAAQMAGVYIRDVSQARQSGVTLGQFAEIDARHIVSGEAHRKGIRAADVARNLRLPYHTGLSSADLLRFRENESDDFEKFRAALNRSIRERIKTASANDDPRSIANDVMDDELLPSLAELNAKMERANSLFAKRSAASIAVGGVVTTIGALGLTPLVASGAVLSAGALLASAADLFKERRDSSLGDMHFLWNIERKAMGHHD